MTRTTTQHSRPVFRPARSFMAVAIGDEELEAIVPYADTPAQETVMSENKHTPERWRLADNDASLVVTEALDADGNCEVVADVVTASGPITAEHHRRARLIAAAPDMLDALQSMAAAVGDWARPTGANGMIAARDDHPLVLAAQSARAAISKATGSEE